MSIGIKQSDCRFYVNEPERTVVCVVPNTESLFKDFIYDNFQFQDIAFGSALIWSESGRFSASLDMPDSFIGKAVCAEDDNWDVEAGKRLAFYRAKNKVYSSFYKRANKFIQTIDGRLGDMISILNEMGMKLQDRKEDMAHEINEMTGMPLKDLGIEE